MLQESWSQYFLWLFLVTIVGQEVKMPHSPNKRCLSTSLDDQGLKDLGAIKSCGNSMPHSLLDLKNSLLLMSISNLVIIGPNNFVIRFRLMVAIIGKMWQTLY